jgi:hypothetical protein
MIVQDPTIGNALGEAFGNIAQGPQMYKLGVETRDLLDKKRAADKYIADNQAYWNAKQPQPVPLPPGYQGPASPVTPQETTQFNLERNRALSAIELGARHASSMGDVAQNDPKLYGQTQMNLQGLPTTMPGLIKMQTNLTGQMPAQLFQPGTTGGENYTVKMPDGSIVDQGITNDWNTHVSGRKIYQPPGSTLLKAGQAPIAEHPMSQQELLLKYKQLTDKASQGIPFTEQEARDAGFLYDQVNPLKRHPQTNQVLDVRDKVDSPADIAVQQAAAKALRPGGPAVTNTPTSAGAAAPAAAAAAGPSTASPAAAAPAQQGGMQPAPAPTAPQSQTVGGVTVTPLPGGSSSQEQLNVTTAAVKADKAYHQLLDVMKVGPDGILTANSYIPNRVSAAISQNYGTGFAGRTAAQATEALYKKGGTDQNVGDYYTIARRWIEPVIRLASGAAINPSEYENYFSMFIPDATDSPKARQLKLDAMRDWGIATSRASTPAGAQAEMMKIAANNPIAMQMVDTMRVLGTENKTNNKTYQELGLVGSGQGAAPGSPQVGAAPAQVVPTQSAPAAAPAQAGPAASVRARADRILGLGR